MKTIYSRSNVCIIELLKFFVKEVEINTEILKAQILKALAEASVLGIANLTLWVEF